MKKPRNDRRPQHHAPTPERGPQLEQLSEEELENVDGGWVPLAIGAGVFVGAMVWGSSPAW